MPKKIDYPRASFKACLELAKAVEDLGGQCNMETCSSKMNKKMSGAFHALVGAATKFGLINRKQGNLYLTDAYEKMKLSYTEEEKQNFLRIFFLNVPVFNDIFLKYKNVKLPVSILDKALIKEFGVDKKLSKRVSKYFIDGAKEVGLLNEDNSFNPLETKEEELENKEGNPLVKEIQKKKVMEEDYSGSDKFIIHIYGRGMNSKIEINEEEDLEIVNAMINKVKKNINSSN